MDNGFVIPGLDQQWTLGGAKIMEWCAGFLMFIILSELSSTSPTRIMPYLMIIWLGTTFGLAALRKKFPDEERGVRNCIALAFGFSPLGVPTPAALQPFWSGAPVKDLRESCYFNQLKLAEIIGQSADDLRGKS
jgi:hypothetical protein